MRSPCVRLPFLAAAAALLLYGVPLGLGGWQDAAFASHDGGADSFLIDMDPSGNTATSVGTVQDCARINKNEVQDADEDAVDTVLVDVVALNIPESHPIVAFEVNIRHGTGIVVDDGDFSQMLAANPGSDVYITDVFEHTPGVTVLRAADPAGPQWETAEAGSGVLVRARLRAVSAGAAIVPVTLRSSGHLDPNNDPFQPDNTFNAATAGDQDYWHLPSSRIAVDQPCPPPLGPTDVAVVNVEPVVDGPVFAGEEFSVQTIATLTNLGPGTVWNYVVSGRPGTGCFYPHGRGGLVSGPPVPSGESVSVVLIDIMQCETPGTILGPEAYAAVIVLDSIDTNLGNNILAGPPVSITVLASDPDGDGVQGSADLCPGTALGDPVDINGCSLTQVDSDADGVCNNDAPSNGPWPGCVRSVAVGGMVGLIAESEETATAGPGNGGSSSSPAPVTLPAAVAGLAALGAAGVYLRRRRVSAASGTRRVGARTRPR